MPEIPETPKIPIDFLANFFQDRKTCGLGSLSIVAQRMAQDMYNLCDLRAYNTQGLIWLQMPRDKAALVHPSIFRALQRGRGNGTDEKGISYNHLALYHGHPVYYDDMKHRYYRNIHSITDNYRFKALMTVVESDPLPPEWAENVRGFDMVIVPSKFCKDVVQRALRPMKINIPVVVVPHGVEADIMRPLPDGGASATNAALRTLHKSPKFKFLMLFTALSFPHRKGVDVALNAFYDEFGDKDKDSVMLIIKAENTRELRDEIAKHPEGPEVLILDERLDLTDLVRLYNIVDTLLLPSRGDAWALDLSNALACGLPAIATKWGGMVDYADDYVTWVHPEKKLVDGICYANVHGQYAEPNHAEMMKAMRKATDQYKKRRKSQIKLSSKFRADWPWSRAAAECVKAMTDVYRAKYGFVGVR